MVRSKQCQEISLAGIVHTAEQYVGIDEPEGAGEKPVTAIFFASAAPCSTEAILLARHARVQLVCGLQGIPGWSGRHPEGPQDLRDPMSDHFFVGGQVSSAPQFS